MAAADPPRAVDLFLRQQGLLTEVVAHLRDLAPQSASLQDLDRAAQRIAADAHAAFAREDGFALVRTPPRGQFREQAQQEVLQHQMESVLQRVGELRSEVDQLHHSSQQQATGTTALSGELGSLQRDIRDAHDAIVTHERDIRECWTRASATADQAQRNAHRLEIDATGLRKVMSEETAGTREQFAKEHEAVHTALASLKAQAQQSERALAELQQQTGDKLEQLRLGQAGLAPRLEAVERSAKDAQAAWSKELEAAERRGRAASHEVRRQLGEKLDQTQLDFSASKQTLEAALAAAEHRQAQLGDQLEDRLRQCRGEVEEARRSAKLYADTLVGDQRVRDQELVRKVEQDLRSQIDLLAAKLDRDVEESRKIATSVRTETQHQAKQAQEEQFEQLKVQLQETRVFEQTVAQDMFSSAKQEVDQLRQETNAQIAHVLANAEAAIDKAIASERKDLHEEIQGLRKQTSQTLGTQLQAVTQEFDGRMKEVDEEVKQQRLKLADQAKELHDADAGLREALLMRLDAQHTVQTKLHHEGLDALGLRLDELGQRAWSAEGGIAELRNNLELLGEETRCKLGQLDAAEQDRIQQLERALQVQTTSTQQTERAGFERIDHELSNLRTWQRQKWDELERQLREQREHHLATCEMHDQKVGQLSATVSESLARQQELAAEHSRTHTSLRQRIDEQQHRHQSSDDQVRAMVVRFEEKDLRQLGQQHLAAKRALGALAQGVVKLSQIVGVLPEQERRDLGVQELLDWEGSGQSLAHRLDQAWAPRVTLKAKSVLDVVNLKADQSSFKLLQLAIRDVDVRVSYMSEAGKLQGWEKGGAGGRQTPSTQAPDGRTTAMSMLDGRTTAMSMDSERDVGRRPASARKRTPSPPRYDDRDARATPTQWGRSPLYRRLGADA